MDEKRRQLLLKILREVIIPRCFPKYQEKLFQIREELNDWPGIAPWVDCFIPVHRVQGDTTDPENHRRGEGTLTCALPVPRLFWDTWFAVYLLENPEYFKNPSIIAKTILDEIQRLKLQPSNFGNFLPAQFDYLVDMAQCHPRTENMFLKNPLEAYVGMQLAFIVESARGALEPDEFVRTNPSIQEQAARMEKDTEQQWRELYPSYFDDEE